MKGIFSEFPAQGSKKSVPYAWDQEQRDAGYVPPMPPLSDVLPDGAWRGAKRCFIIGGGPSLKSFKHWYELKHELTIGINAAFVRAPTIAFSEDVRFQDFVCGKEIERPVSHLLRKRWPDCKSLKIFHNVQPARARREFPGCLVVENAGRHEWSDSFRKGLCWGTNSAISALNLADILMGGEGTIYLLGIDMKGVKGKVAHWHNYYPDSWRPDDDVYSRQFIPCFEAIAPKVRSRVVNLNPDSALDCFPKATWEDEIEEIRRPLVVAYYTAGTAYKDEAQKLAETCRRFSLKYHIESISDFGSWKANVKYKPQFISHMLESTHLPVLYVDADARFLRYPAQFEGFHNGWVDVGGHIFQRTKDHPLEFMGGTLYFANNSKARAFLGEWIENVKRFSDDPYGDMAGLMETLRSCPENVQFRDIMAEYCWIEDAMRSQLPDAKPVILHTQASRRFKT